MPTGSAPPPSRAKPAPVVKPAEPPRDTLALTQAPPAPADDLSIVSPANGQRFSPADALSLPLQVHSNRPEWIVEVALDGRRARPLPTLPSSPTLGDLAGATLADGEHYVVAALRPTEHEPARFSVSRFWVGAGTNAKTEPIVHCGRPAGTYYAATADSLLLDFAVDGFTPGTDGVVLVRAYPMGQPERAREARLRDVSPRLMSGIASGDWTVELTLLDASGRPLGARSARHGCDLTINEVRPP